MHFFYSAQTRHGYLTRAVHLTCLKMPGIDFSVGDSENGRIRIRAADLPFGPAKIRLRGIFAIKYRTIKNINRHVYRSDCCKSEEITDFLKTVHENGALLHEIADPKSRERQSGALQGPDFGIREAFPGRVFYDGTDGDQGIPVKGSRQDTCRLPEEPDGSSNALIRGALLIRSDSKKPGRRKNL